MKLKFRKIFLIVFEVFSSSFLLVSFIVVIIGVFVLGYSKGSKETFNSIQSQLEKLMSSQVPQGPQSQDSVPEQVVVGQLPTWGGPDLWEAVNKRRKELGVNSLDQKDELCTIAAIRLNQLLEMGKLDGHEGFSNMPENRPDLVWIFEKYNLSEFLVSGAQSASDAVSLWENTLGHKKLLTGGEYVWGCIYAQAGTAVAIAAY